MDDGFDVFEFLILITPIVLAGVIQLWDYMLTVYAVHYGGAYEMNPFARQFLESGRYFDLAAVKGIEVLLYTLVYLFGVVFHILGKQKENFGMKYLGDALITLVFIGIFVGIIIVTFDVASIGQILASIR